MHTIYGYFLIDFDGEPASIPQLFNSKEERYASIIEIEESYRIFEYEIEKNYNY